MLIATVAVALSVTMTLIYLIFYSMSKNTERSLDYLDWDFKILAIYALIFVFIKAELGLYPVRFGDTLTLMDLCLIITVLFLLITLILAQFKHLQAAAWWLTFTFIFILGVVDFFFLSSHQQVKNFYIPMFVTLFVVATAGLFVFFHFPERICSESRLPQLYFNSHVWFSLAYLLLLLEFIILLNQMFKYDE